MYYMSRKFQQIREISAGPVSQLVQSCIYFNYIGKFENEVTQLAEPTEQEIVQGVVTNKEGINVDREFRAGAAKALAIAKENGVELAILQSRSPSCGVKEIYDGTFSGTKIPGQGVFAKMLMDEGIRVLDAGELPKIILKNEDGKCQSD